MSGISHAQVPGNFWVEFLPFLRYIPSWVPGAGFKKFIEKHTKLTKQMLDIPFDTVKREMVWHDVIFILKLIVEGNVGRWGCREVHCSHLDREDRRRNRRHWSQRRARICCPFHHWSDIWQWVLFYPFVVILTLIFTANSRSRHSKSLKRTQPLQYSIIFYRYFF